MLKKNNKNLLLRFIAPYAIIVVIVFVAQYISNAVVMHALKNNAINIVETSFESDVDVIEQNLVKVKEKAVVVAQNVAVNLEKVERNSNGFYTQLIEIKNELLTYYAGNDIIKDICVQNDNNNCLVGFERAYSDRLHFYKTKADSEGITASQLLAASETANGFSTENICYYSSESRVIPFVYPTPILKKRTGAVFVYIDQRKLLLPMRDTIEKSGGLLQVFNADGKSVLTDGKDRIALKFDEIKSIGSARRVNGENYCLFTFNGDASGWKYVISLPENYVLSGMKRYQLISILFNLFILIVGFAICLFFAVRKSKSYIELLDTLEIKPDNFGIKSFVYKNEYSELRQHISNIKDENLFFLKSGSQSVLRRLLNEQFKRKEDIIKELKNHKVEFKNSQYAVMAVKYTTESFNEEKIKSFEGCLINRICQYIPDAMVCFVEKNILAVLFPDSGHEHNNFVKNCVERVKNEIFARYSTKILIGIGNTVPEFIEISFSYKEALETLKYASLMGEQKLSFYKELPKDDEYFYPIEVESALFKSALESDYESARNILQDIYEENFVKRQLCVSATYELLTELQVSIRRISRMQTEYLEFTQEEYSVNKFFEYAISFLYIICSNLENNKENANQSRGQEICAEIKNYIELNYSNPLISLEMIADKFRIHPNYLSSMFKKQMGINLMTFLENVRIEKAEALLLCGKYTVNEIAFSVGFSNDTTFRRSFKKVKGVPPSNFIRSQH